ncbi:cytochrome oxidase [Photobacterium proteolyticum]|uniref:Cytochrome oxidase n=1 Tax=Photobacterium proteolyticum TaxID=1903952 RepID=A0A1Q9GGF9_9GAMM|nr:cytochrome oxidase [Photobacterium proteolyticum]OLQ73553.1 cytochrome oxidase [Photobacterium proteolyticum]
MKKHGTLLLLLSAFLLPVALAKLVLDLNWYQGGVTNRGELLSTPVAADWLGQKGKWQLVYLMPDDCDELCAGALFNLRQIPLAVGAGQDRVGSVLLVTEASQTAGDQLQGVEQVLAPDHVIEQLRTLEYGARAIYIADPLGNVMMAYPLVKGRAAILAQGKDLLRDLKRLLKVSKIG